MSDGPKVLALGGKRHQDVCAEMAEKIMTVIHEFDGKITVAATVGVLHIVAREVMNDQFKD